MFWSVGVMLTNAYIMYVKVMQEEYGIEKKHLISHHDFREAIALYWINPKEYDDGLKTEANEGKRKRSSASTISSITNSTPVSYNKNKRIKTGLHHVTDQSLCPIKGSLRCRLDPQVDHIPDEANGRARCRLHWWGGVETQKRVLACPECGVSFCVKCYRLFHKEPNIVAMKAKLKKEFRKVVQPKTKSYKK